MRKWVSDKLVMARHRRTLELECGKQCHTTVRKKKGNILGMLDGVRGLVSILKLISG